MKSTSSPAISLAFSLLVSSAHLCHGEKTGGPHNGPGLCPTRTSCLDCLRDPFCGSWNNAGGCGAGCASPDGSPCYQSSPSISLASYGNDETIEDVCAKADMDKANDAICSAATDCGNCTGTDLSNGVGTCAWYKGGGYCGRPGCTLSPVKECGDTTCPATKVEEANNVHEGDLSARPAVEEANVVVETGDHLVEKDCSTHHYCLACMNDSECGSWSLGNGCSADCMANDLSCYKRKGNEFASTACMRATARSSPSDKTEFDGGNNKAIIMPNEKVEVKIEEKKQNKKKKGKRDRLRGRKYI